MKELRNEPDVYLEGKYLGHKEEQRHRDMSRKERAFWRLEMTSSVA